MKRRLFLKATSTTAMLGPSSFSVGQNRESAEAIDAMPDYLPTGVELLRESNPKSDGYFVPAEWHRHESTIMVMPSPQNWRGFGIAMKHVRQQWADVANELAQYEDVLMVVRRQDRRAVQRLLDESIGLVDFPVNDGWSRDSGPMFVIDGKGNRRVSGFTFNGWGAKFPPFDDDALLKGRLCEYLQTPMYPIDFVLEGGAVTVDGEGTVITTEQCLLHPNRNTKHNKSQIEAILNQALGTQNVIWLGKGLEPDPVTDGHVDGICAFVAPGVVMLHTTDDRSDPNCRICQDAKRRLESVVDAKGRQLEIIDVPLDGDVSYLNFYIANGAVLVPVTGDPRQDERPMGVIKDFFDGRYDVAGIESNVLAEGGGGIHCITQQVPALDV
ncbi:MAG: agmatine deiminase family protein [Planctomycetota bacterium]